MPIDDAVGRSSTLPSKCESFDDLLGTYARLKILNILPLWAADHGVGTAIYYEDPERNVVEISVNNYANALTATEFYRGTTEA